MIARLRGRAVANTPDGLVVDVGGVGYLVAATPSAVRQPTAPTRSRCTRTCTCGRTRSSSTASRTRPSATCSCNCSPSMASARRSRSRSCPARPPRTCAGRSCSKTPLASQAIPGIGKKTAERIVLELKEKLGDAPVPISSAAAERSRISSRATRSSSSATPLGEAEHALAPSIRSCRRRNGYARR